MLGSVFVVTLVGKMLQVFLVFGWITPPNAGKLRMYDFD